MSNNDLTEILAHPGAESGTSLVSELQNRLSKLEELITRRGYDTRPIYEKHELEINALQQEVEVLKGALLQAGIPLVLSDNGQLEGKPVEGAVNTPVLGERHTEFFSQRIAKAFPGSRNLIMLSDPNEALKRLAILFSNPLIFRLQDGGISAPIWWWRGERNDQIKQFEILSETKCIMNFDELEIDKLVAYRGKDSYRDFVYVETKAEQPIGVYNYKNGHVDEQVEQNGFCHEEYGLFDSKVISKEEFDDGAALIEGKIVETIGQASLRCRYLSKYNFIVASKLSPINSKNEDGTTQCLLDGILKGLRSLDDLLGFIEDLPRHESDV